MDSGGYSAWLDASQRCRDGVWLNSEMLWSVLRNGYCIKIIENYLYYSSPGLFINIGMGWSFPSPAPSTNIWRSAAKLPRYGFCVDCIKYMSINKNKTCLFNVIAVCLLKLHFLEPRHVVFDVPETGDTGRVTSVVLYDLSLLTQLVTPQLQVHQLSSLSGLCGTALSWFLSTQTPKTEDLELSFHKHYTYFMWCSCG